MNMEMKARHASVLHAAHEFVPEKRVAKAHRKERPRRAVNGEITLVAIPSTPEAGDKFQGGPAGNVEADRPRLTVNG
jgi:hypothetical protein